VFDYKDPEVSKKIKEASGGRIKVCMDGISEHGSVKLAADAMSDEGGKIVTICRLPRCVANSSSNDGHVVTPKDKVPSAIEVIPTLIYSVLETKNQVDRDDIAEWYVSTMVSIFY
jgi:hypothetical protein